MPEIDMPIFNGVYKNVDKTMLTDRSFALYDGILDKDGNLFSRPGLSVRINQSTGASYDGMKWIDELSKLFAITGGALYCYSYDGANIVPLGLGGVTINANRRPTFAFDGTRVLAANGGQIMYSNGTAAAAFLADADAPTRCTHLFMLDSYLIANDYQSGTWKFSVPGDVTNWSSIDFATAEFEPDPIIAGIRFGSEAFFFGTRTLEIWENDGQTPFVRVNGGAFDVGCIAPYSVINLNGKNIMWLTDKSRFARYAGGGIEILETPYDKEIQNFISVSDCQSDQLEIYGKSFVIFQFKSQGRTIAYNVTDNNWGEFSYFNPSNSTREAFLGNCCEYFPPLRMNFWGSRRPEGLIFDMVETNLLDYGDSIRVQSTSGDMNYGTNKEKICESVSFRAKRGHTVSVAAEPVATLRYKNNNEEWSNEIPFSLGKMGNYFNLVKLNRLGRYYSRQYEFVCTDAVGLVFSQAKEDISLVGR